MKKVLIVSYCFPPIDMMAAKRFGTMCKYFELYGYKPYILTTKPSGDWGVKARFESKLPVDRKQIIQIGTHRTNGDVKNILRTYVIWLLKKCKYNSQTINAISLGWYERVKKNINLNQLQDMDIIVGTFPVMGDLYVAVYLSKKLKCPYIADIRDLISDYPEASEEFKRARLLDYIVEKNVLNKASGIVTVTPGYKKVLRKRYPKKKFHVVFNGWDDEKQQLSSKQEKKYLYYAGSLYLHRLESLKILIGCLKEVNSRRTEKLKLLIRSIGPKALDAKLKNIVEQTGMQEDVDIFEASEEVIVREEEENAYINVVLSTIHEEDVALMTTIPGKVYELLNKRTPILAVVPKDSDVGKVLHYTNKGLASVSEDEIIDFVLGGCKQYVGNNKIDFFTRKKQSERFCKFMDRVLEK